MIDPEDFEPLPSDPIDQASQQEQRALAANIAAAAVITKRLPMTPGLCDFCGDPTESPQHLFCGSDCRDGDALERKMRARNGRS